MSQPIEQTPPLFTSIAAYLRYFARIHARTVEVVKALPPAQLDWRLAPGEWSLADIARHIPSVYQMNCRRVAGEPLRYPGHASEFGQTLPEVLAYLDRCYQEATALLAAQPDSILTDRRPLARGHRAPGWLILLANLEHTIHHRSQLAAYLKIIGAEPPPLFGMFAEDLPTE